MTARPPYLARDNFSGTVFELNAYRTLIGADAGCDVVLAASTVGPKCAEIIQRGFDHYFVAAIDPSAGVFVNGRSVKGATRIRDGDRIRLGTEQLIFHDTSASYVRPRPQYLLAYAVAIAGFVGVLACCYEGIKRLYP